MTTAELLDAAKAQGIVSDAEVASAAEVLARDTEEHRTPWYLHGVIAIGAWIASAFFITFFLAIGGGALTESPPLCVGVGLVIIVLSTLGRRASTGIFWGQVCLAFSVAGYGLVLGGVGEKAKQLDPVVIASIALAAVVYPFYRDPLHRFLACASALALSTIWLNLRVSRFFFSAAEAQHAGTLNEVLFSASLLVHLGGIGFIFVRSRTGTAFRPLGYALVVSLLGLVVPWAIPFVVRMRFHTEPSQAIVAIALAALCVWAAGGVERLKAAPLPWTIIFVLVAALSAAGTPAILIAIGLLILGYARQETMLVALGALSLPIFLSLHYYNLEMDLARKSYLLAASGAVLLGARAAITRLRWSAVTSDR